MIKAAKKNLMKSIIHINKPQKFVTGFNSMDFCCELYKASLSIDNWWYYHNLDVEHTERKNMKNQQTQKKLLFYHTCEGLFWSCVFVVNEK